MLYTSIDNKKIKDIKKLHQKKYRDKTGLFLVETEHLVLEAYKKGFIEELILEQDTIFPLNVKTSYVTNDVMHYLSDLESPSNMIAICHKQENTNLGDHILILDDIQDPGNLGTIIRSAVAFHMDAIILGEHTVDLYNSKVIRASQGMLFHIPIMKLSLLEILPELENKGYEILGTKVTHGSDIKTLEKNQKFAIIMGNEGNGIREEVEELCHKFIYIDMNEVCESINVAVAASIILYELDK